MIDHGDQPDATPPPPPRYPPPPAPPAPAPPTPPAPTAFAWDVPAPNGRVADVDPASAGLIRVERLGWATVAAGIGTALLIVSFFLGWVEAKLFVIYAPGQEGPLTSGSERPGIFSAVDVVRDYLGPDPDTDGPGAFAQVFFPWLAIVVTIVCIALALAAAVGLRRAALTNTLRVGTVLAGVVAVAVTAIGYVSLGTDWGGGGAVAAAPVTSGSGDAASFISGDIEPYAGFSLWLLGVVLLMLAGALGPRIQLRLPPGASAPTYGGSAVAGGGGVAGSAPVVRYATQVSALVCASLAAVLCLTGFGFLSWTTSGDTVTFGEIGGAVRDAGASSYAGAYFGWLGWVVLLWISATAGLVLLGRSTAGPSPKVLRPVLAIGTLLAGVLHAGALLEVSGYGADLGVGALATSLGVALALVATVLPLRVTARVVVGREAPSGPHW